jgi:diguanylate cyclase (GGDEF)-like protein
VAAPAVRGVGIAEAGGHLLWGDDAFCAVVGHSRDELLGAGIAGVLAFSPEDAAAATGGGLVRIAGEGGAPVLRLTPLGPADRPAAFVLEVGGASGPQPASPGRGAVAAAFILDGEGAVSGIWGAAQEVALLGPGFGVGPATGVGGASMVTELVAHALRGVAASGLLLVDGIPREARCFPVDLPGRDRPGLVVAVTPATRRFRGAAGPPDLQSGLARLARHALAGADRRLLVEEAVRTVQGALGAEACAVFEFLPERRAALRSAGPSAPEALAPTAGGTDAAATGAAPGDMPEGLLIAPVNGPPPFGVLAVQRRSGAGFDAEEMLFVAGAADILAVALRRLAREERQRHAALHDPLTGLPNRALILDHLGLALARAPRQSSPVGVLFVDLERFKLVNDTLGHGAGDELLVAVAGRLAGVLRPSDTLGRLGGDEFLVVCEDIGGEADARAVAGRLAAVFRAPFRLAGQDVQVSASIGLAVSKPGSEPAALVGEADAAMYASKHARRQAPVLFEERIRPAPDDRIALSAVSGDPGGDRSGEPRPAPGTVGGPLSGLVARLVGMLEDVAEVDDPAGDYG